MLTIKQWQQPGHDTRVYNKFDAFKCHECCATHICAAEMSLICCVDDRTSVQYCSDCWDNVEWNCPDCNTVPKDCDVIGCERCGKWSHTGCQINIEDKINYVCVSCKASARAHTLVPKMKIECYDLAKNLETVQKQLEEKKALLHSLRQAREKETDMASNEMAALKDVSAKELETKNNLIQLNTKLNDDKESFQQAYEKTLSELKVATKYYETKIDEQASELERADNKVAALVVDVMQQADDVQLNIHQKCKEILTLKGELKVSKAELANESDELKASKVEIADVHCHYAKEISTLKTVLSNKQRAEEQEITALRENNKRLLSDNCSLAKSNTKLKHSLQNVRTTIADTMSAFKKNNKRARYIYEQQGEQIAALKKARVTLRWNGSMPKRLQERLVLQRCRDAWVELNCQWQDYFGEMRVRAHCGTGPVVYNTLDGFMVAMRRRKNEKQ